MDMKRYIIVQAIKTNENELIPVWDERIYFEKTEQYGNTLQLKGDSYCREHFNLVECIYDLKTRKVETGVELNYYPTEEELEFKKGQVVLVERSHRKLSEAIISDIVYEEYDLHIKRGRKFENYEIKRFKDITIEADTLYAIKNWKPFYILDNGTKIEWSHDLYEKFDGESSKSVTENETKLLIEDYKRKLVTISEIISNNKNNGSTNDIKRTERFLTKQSEYKTFIVELERVLKNQS